MAEELVTIVAVLTRIEMNESRNKASILKKESNEENETSVLNLRELERDAIKVGVGDAIKT